MSDAQACCTKATGAVLAVIECINFTNVPDAPNVAGLRFERHDCVTDEWVKFAEVFRHPCGEVVVKTPNEGGCVTLETLLRYVVPAMDDFDNTLVAVDAAWRQREYDAKLKQEGG
jgi:hypothetical protein